MSPSPSLLIPVIETVQHSARVLIGVLDLLKSHLQAEQKAAAQSAVCAHSRRQDESTMGLKRWRCTDCGYIEEKET